MNTGIIDHIFIDFNFTCVFCNIFNSKTIKRITYGLYLHFNIIENYELTVF